jgi:DNA-binding transcriptional MerR regulator
MNREVPALQQQLTEAQKELAEMTAKRDSLGKQKSHDAVYQGELERANFELTDQNAAMRAALERILAEPYGCAFCDSGVLREFSRKRGKDHADDRPFSIARRALSSPAPSKRDARRVVEQQLAELTDQNAELQRRLQTAERQTHPDYWRAERIQSLDQNATLRAALEKLKDVVHELDDFHDQLGYNAAAMQIIEDALTASPAPSRLAKCQFDTGGYCNLPMSRRLAKLEAALSASSTCCGCSVPFDEDECGDCRVARMRVEALGGCEEVALAELERGEG